MCYFVVFFYCDEQYIVVDNESITFEQDGLTNLDIAGWTSFFEKHTTIRCLDAKVLYEDDVYKCAIISVADNEECADDVVRKVRKIVLEKKSSLRTILKFIPKIAAGRTKVPPLSHMVSSDDNAATATITPVRTNPPPLSVKPTCVATGNPPPRLLVPITSPGLATSSSSQNGQIVCTQHCRHIERKF